MLYSWKLLSMWFYWSSKKVVCSLSCNYMLFKITTKLNRRWCSLRIFSSSHKMCVLPPPLRPSESRLIDSLMTSHYSHRNDHLHYPRPRTSLRTRKIEHFRPKLPNRSSSLKPSPSRLPLSIVHIAYPKAMSKPLKYSTPSLTKHLPQQLTPLLFEYEKQPAFYSRVWDTLQTGYKIISPILRSLFH